MADSQSSGQDFGAYLEANLASLRTEFHVGDKIEGVVTATGRTSVFVDIRARSDGIIERSELTDDDGNLTVEVGDQITAYYVGFHHEEGIRLSIRMAGRVAEATFDDAYETGIPVEGKVTEERKGGYTVELAGQEAFCPYSQIDLFRREPETYIGQRFAFVITENSEGGRNLVLSRRTLLEREREQQREQLQESLAVGDFVDGKVTRLMPFGAFVDIGGVEGLVHVSELGWGHGTKPEDVLQPGQSVRVVVLQLDWKEERFSLSLKRAAGDPWETVETSDNYLVGQRLEGTIVQLAPFGAFVELEPGIQGLVHVSQLGAGKRINHPDEVVSIGDRVEVVISNIDFERRRIALTMDGTLGADIEQFDDLPGIVVQPGSRVTGVIDGVRDFGAFVRLPDERSGLLHVSEIELRGSTNQRRALFDMFPPGSSIEVVVREIRGDRISLTLPETLERESEKLDAKDMTDSAGESLGSLGDLLGGLDL